MLSRLLVLLLVLVAVAAFLAPLLAPYDPEQIDLDAVEQPPSRLHLLGTDRLGRDVLSRLLLGARNSLAVGVLAASLGCGLGVLAGGVAGYAGHWLDDVLMRMADLMLALPTFFLLIAVQALVPARAWSVALIIALTRWMAMARLVRGRFLSLRERGFVLAARATGSTGWRIVLRHMLPNTLGEITVFVTLVLADAILVESALSFLGLGLPPGQPSWGTMLADGRASILSGAWWAILFPGLAILLVTGATNLLGDELQGRFRRRL
jgi:peptide/nickel transport system permease protein